MNTMDVLAVARVIRHVLDCLLVTDFPYACYENKYKIDLFCLHINCYWMLVNVIEHSICNHWYDMEFFVMNKV